MNCKKSKKGKTPENNYKGSCDETGEKNLWTVRERDKCEKQGVENK